MNRASADRYANFKELSQNETEGVDYSVFARTAGKGLLVMSPHGGGIEPGISEIVRAFADRASVYLFEGIKPRGNKDLHVTSACFDDPLAVKMAADHQYVLAFHGYFDPSHCHTLVGGTDRKRAAIFVNALRRHGFFSGIAGKRRPFFGNIPGKHQQPVQNRAERAV